MQGIMLIWINIRQGDPPIMGGTVVWGGVVNYIKRIKWAELTYSLLFGSQLWRHLDKLPQTPMAMTWPLCYTVTSNCKANEIFLRFVLVFCFVFIFVWVFMETDKLNQTEKGFVPCISG